MNRIILFLFVVIVEASLSACVHVDSGISRTSTTSYALPSRLALILTAEGKDPDSETLAKLAKCVNEAAAIRGLDMDARVYPGTIDPGLKKIADLSLQQQLAGDGVNWIHVLSTAESKNTNVEAGGSEGGFGFFIENVRSITLNDTVMVQTGELKAIADINVSGDSSGGFLIGLAFIFPVAGVLPRMPVDRNLCEEFGNSVVDFHLDAQVPQPPAESSAPEVNQDHQT